jgi:thymidylate synthase ThyX
MNDTPLLPEFTATERAVLEPFVTSVDARIFGLRNLPEVVKGALFSRYSRSEKSIRRILLDEFIHQAESGFHQLVPTPNTTTTDQIVATKQAEAFYDRVLVGYGDDSVAELGGAHVACEEISNVAAKILEDARIGISPLEKSTRYVSFTTKINGMYRYVREESIMSSAHADAYIAAMDGLFDTYAALLAPTITWVQQQSPRAADTSERAYTSATRAKAFDLLRGLLPMATRTNVGMYGNGRAFEYLMTRAGSHDLAELRELQTALADALGALIPSFVKRASSPRGAALRAYLADIRQAGKAATEKLRGMDTPQAPNVTLVHAQTDALQRVVAAILYPHADTDYQTVAAHVTTLSTAQLAGIVADACGQRAVRFHKPGRAFEEAQYTFDIVADIGAYRDLQRHRMLTQERQPYGVELGYTVPPELVAAGLDTPFRAALDGAVAVTRRIRADLPEASQYAVPMACHMRWRISLNLREAFHFCELRSTPQGHPSYRRVAQDMYRLLRDVHPELTAAMHFVDLNEYALERLDAEKKLDQKRAALQ